MRQLVRRKAAQKIRYYIYKKQCIQLPFTCSKSTIERLEKDVYCVQSQQ